MSFRRSVRIVNRFPILWSIRLKRTRLLLKITPDWWVFIISGCISKWKPANVLECPGFKLLSIPNFVKIGTDVPDGQSFTFAFVNSYCAGYLYEISNTYSHFVCVFFPHTNIFNIFVRITPAYDINRAGDRRESIVVFGPPGNISYEIHFFSLFLIKPIHAPINYFDILLFWIVDIGLRMTWGGRGTIVFFAVTYFSYDRFDICYVLPKSPWGGGRRRRW